MSPLTLEKATLALLPWTTWTLPPTREFLRTMTLRAFSPWTLPMTLTLMASSRAPLLILIVPLTFVPFNVHDSPLGTFTLSSVLAPIVPRQTVSSATATCGTTTVVVTAANRITILRFIAPPSCPDLGYQDECSRWVGHE